MAVLYRILPFIAMFGIVAVVNKFLVEPLWGELLFIAVAAGGATYVAGKLSARGRGCSV
ncbi:hypothetical protein AB0N23_02810 [Streptomyces sp. NPDC052644]